MSFILKENPVVISIKLTNKGREQLSKGELTFKKFAIGDSEINYEYNEDVSLTPIDINVLRPKDSNPNILYYLKKTNTSDILNNLPTISTNTSILTNTATERGFFEYDGTSWKIITNASHAKQPNIVIDMATVNGGKTLNLLQYEEDYISNITEPIVGDFIFVAWGNPINSGDTDISITNPIPYLWYKIEDIVSGTLAGNNLVITVDKSLPDFNSGATGNARAIIYPHSNNREVSGSSIQNYYGSQFITDFISESVFSFIENYDTPTIDVPIWNMSIVFTEAIAGIQLTDRRLEEFKTKKYGGFVKYIQRISSDIKNIGIIHYTNNSPSNNYGEGFFNDSPVLDLPTIMWHKNEENTIGLKLSADTESRNTLPDLNTLYYNLVDEYGNTLGKVFNDLKIFVIEDQELLFAMSYKANRNWTLPEIYGDFNVSLCETCDLSFIESGYVATNPSTIGGSDGSITINVENNVGVLTYTLNSTNSSSNTFNNLSAGTYIIKVTDDGAPNCVITTSVTLVDPTSELELEIISVT